MRVDAGLKVSQTWRAARTGSWLGPAVPSTAVGSRVTSSKPSREAASTRPGVTKSPSASISLVSRGTGTSVPIAETRLPSIRTVAPSMGAPSPVWTIALTIATA
jgi:hypothetical protein